MIIIYIQNKTIGKTIKVGVELQYPMKRVKELISDRQGYPVDQQELDDDVQFMHYYMHAEMHFQLTVKGQQERLEQFRKIRQRKKEMQAGHGQLQQQTKEMKKDQAA